LYYGNLRLHLGERPRAEYYFRNALKLEPQFARAHESMAYLWMIRENYKEAKAAYQQALKLNPNRALTHYLYGVALYGEVAGKNEFADEVPPETAKAIYDEAIAALKLQSNFSSSYVLLARLCLNPGESLDEGLRLIDTAIRAKPRSKWMKFTRAQLLYRKGECEAARKILTPLTDESENPRKIYDLAKLMLANVERAEKKH
jgi:tetratricopeptide (TPR) repeat protein